VDVVLTKIMSFVVGAILLGGGIAFSKKAWDLDMKAVLDPMALGVIVSVVGAWLCYTAIFGTELFDW
jgi:hypothetical protein